MKKNNTLFLDFNDSFSLNIVSEFYRLGVEVTVINFDDLCKMDNLKIEGLLNHKNLVLGPGPGHPDDYFRFYQFKELINGFINNEGRFILGICLGHQIIGKLMHILKK